MLDTCALVIAAFLAGPAPADTAATAEKLFQSLGFTAEEQEQLRQGEIVSHAFPELSDKELSITMAVLAPVPMSSLLDFARSGKGLEINRDILLHGDLGDGTADEKALQNAGFTKAQASEINDLFQVEPGSKFNLSAAEMGRFTELRKRFTKKACGTDPACSAAVTSEFRGVLRDRIQAYRQRGLSGVEPYAREGGKTASPAEELRKAANAAQILAKQFPAVFDAYVNYPKGDQSGIENKFLWLQQNIQDRPTFILSHRMLQVHEGIALAAERQFYVGQSYNSLQIFYGLLPQGGKTLVFYLNRTSTDQVAGFMSGTRHGVGRKIMEKEVQKWFEQVLASLGKGSQAAPPASDGPAAE